MLIRKFQPADAEEVSKLFYETVNTVNAKDYTKEQLSVWAPDVHYLNCKLDGLLKQRTVVAEEDGEITGFGSIDKDGCLDMLFVHKKFQRKGIASAICNELEKDFAKIKTFASITVKPFFEKRGYIVLNAREVERNGVKLKNYEMLKNKSLLSE